MLEQITYYMILGKPLIFYSGILTLLSFIFAATISKLNKKGIRIIPFKWHSRVAYIAIALGIIHGLMGLLAYL